MILPLLLQRCNGTSAGQGYLKVNVICPCESPHWVVDCTVRTDQCKAKL
jgi:hypothetical protein